MIQLATLDPKQAARPSAKTEPVRLVFALHFHQPFGNLDEVFADATDRCYLPTADLLLENPHVATAIHISGPLLDWTESHRPEFIDKVAKLVLRGQVEVLGGGLQEPMLAILPDRDAIGQLRAMADRCEQLLSSRPQGMWLAERVWEPDLARIIAQAGYRYTLLDDSHLHAAGVGTQLDGYYVTEKAGSVVAILPIDRGLRTRIPFADHEPLFEYLLQHPGLTLTYGDDAEKFGLWPTTHKRVWEKKWLERFYDLLREHDDQVQTIRPQQLLAEQSPRDIVYMPTISYAEMGAWTLPPAASNQYQTLCRRLHLAGFGPQTEQFVRGGIWQGFLAKYPESRLIHRKMLRVSEAVQRAGQRGDDNFEAARDALYRGQCNCAYWHGLFGGLYMQHLRAALMSTLIAAENLVEPRDDVAVTVTDHLGNLQNEVLIEAPEVNLYLSPERGGSVFELDLKRACHHLTGVLGRRREAYHDDVLRAQYVPDDELENVSAHDLIRATEPGLADKLRFDAYPRGAFVDHLLPADATAEQFDLDYRPLVNLPTARYELRGLEQDGRTATLGLQFARDGFRLNKRVFVESGRKFAVHYRLEHASESQPLKFGSELDFTLLSPGAPGFALHVLGDDDRAAAATGENSQAPGAAAMHRNVQAIRLVASPFGVDLTLRVEPRAELWRLPIETVSQSERGFESSYQGTALILLWNGRVSAQHPLEAKIEVELAADPE